MDYASRHKAMRRLVEAALAWSRLHSLRYTEASEWPTWMERAESEMVEAARALLEPG